MFSVRKIVFTAYFITLFSLGFFGIAQANDESVCNNPQLARLPILANGRVKPLVVHAIDSMKAIYGKTGRKSALATYCRISFSFSHPMMIPVEHVELRARLGMGEKQETISLEELQPRQNELMGEMHQLASQKQEKSPYGKALNRLIFSLSRYQDVIYGNDWLIPVNTQGNPQDWISLTEFRTQEAIGSPEEVVQSMITRGNQYLSQMPKSTVSLEYFYHRLNLISYKLLAALLAFVVVFLTQKKSIPTQFRVGGVAVVFILLLSILDFTLRILISGRGPVTNMYETVLWVGMGITLFATILAFVKQRPVYFLFGLSGMLLTNFMNRFAPAMVDPAINPLVPVLRDNFWLSTHVTTVTISYAAFALSWIIGNSFMIRSIFSNPKKLNYADYSDLAYAAIKIGVVLLAAGVILGGVWADYSWGRFWGWDPKETWSLIALLIYVAILHGRYAGWIKPKHFLPAISVAFLSILMCWFGVNYILASGLHSYGFSENGTIFLISLFSLQFAILGLYFFRNAKNLNPSIS